VRSINLQFNASHFVHYAQEPEAPQPEVGLHWEKYSYSLKIIFKIYPKFLKYFLDFKNYK